MKFNQKTNEFISNLAVNILDNSPFNNSPSIKDFIPQDIHAKNYIPNELLVSDLERYIEKDTAPIPCASDREFYSPNRDLSYWCTGLSDYLKVMHYANKYDVSVDRYFDFGCASGRIIRQFVFQSNVDEIWGSDLNERHIRWIMEYLPNTIKPINNTCLPYLPLPDNYFDLVTAFSVFTHISTFDTAWLSELRRITKPKGLLYITLQMGDSWEFWQSRCKKSPTQGDVKWVLNQYPEFTNLKLTNKVMCVNSGAVGPYHSLIFHSEEYILKNWSRYFDVVEIIPKYHGGANQAVVILRKP